MNEGINMDGNMEQKLAIFPDDLLVYLSSPADSHHELILDEYRLYSSYKLNKNQISGS